MIGRNPHPEPILDGEDGERQEFDRGEYLAVPLLQVRHRFQGDCHEIDDDEKHDELTDGTAGPITDRSMIQDFAEAGPQFCGGSSSSYLHAGPHICSAAAFRCRRPMNCSAKIDGQQLIQIMLPVVLSI
jgi:hypothetical protein